MTSEVAANPITTEMQPARPVDHEQALVLEALASADGKAVTVEELERRGVVRPASVGYELAAAGWPVIHARVAENGRRRPALRLVPSLSLSEGQLVDDGRTPAGVN